MGGETSHACTPCPELITRIGFAPWLSAGESGEGTARLEVVGEFAVLADDVQAAFRASDEPLGSGEPSRGAVATNRIWLGNDPDGRPYRQCERGWAVSPSATRRPSVP